VRAIVEDVAGRAPVIVTTKHFASQVCAERSRLAHEPGATSAEPAVLERTAAALSLYGRGAYELGAQVRKSSLAMHETQTLAIFENVYAGPNAQLDYERERFAGYLDSFSGEEAGA